MTKEKAPARDYEADLRVEPLPEIVTTEDLWARGHSFIKGVFGGAGVKKPEPAAE